MGRPRDHFVPRFYLARFADSAGQVWVFDKVAGRVFHADPSNLAAETGFYDAVELQGTEAGPRFLEAQFADLEREAASITDCWLRQVGIADTVVIPDVNREIMSLYIATQLLRTAEARHILVEGTGLLDACDGPLLANAHARLLCADDTVATAKALAAFVWIFGVNESGVPFYTSDQPVAVRSHPGHRCYHPWQFPQPGSELMFPLSPTVMFYAYEPTHFAKLKGHDARVSPVAFTPELVQSDNMPQIGHSTRFVFCNADRFDFARGFCNDHPAIRGARRNRLVPGEPEG